MDVVLEKPERVIVQSKPPPRNWLRQTSPRSQPFEWKDTPQASTQKKVISEATAVDSDLPRHVPRPRLPDPAVVHQVQTIISQIINSLQKQDDDISVSLRTKRPSIGSSSQSSTRPSNDFYKLSFPGSTPEEAWRFSTAALAARVCSRTSSMLTCSPAVVLRILELVHEALVTKMLISKRFTQTSTESTLWIKLMIRHYRNIYYKDPELFKSQTVVDRYVDIIAYTLGVQRAALNVVSLSLFHLLRTLLPCSLALVLMYISRPPQQRVSLPGPSRSRITTARASIAKAGKMYVCL